MSAERCGLKARTATVPQTHFLGPQLQTVVCGAVAVLSLITSTYEFTNSSYLLINREIAKTAPADHIIVLNTYILYYIRKLIINTCRKTWILNTENCDFLKKFLGWRLKPYWVTKMNLLLKQDLQFGPWTLHQPVKNPRAGVSVLRVTYSFHCISPEVVNFVLLLFSIEFDCKKNSILA